MTSKSKTPKDWKEQVALIAADQQAGNHLCADCQEANPEWCVYNHGIFVCINCAGIHRQLGVHISKVKSTQFDTWQQEYIDNVKQRGNIQGNKIQEAYMPKYHVSPFESQAESVRRYFIQQKYQHKTFTQESASKFEMPQCLMAGVFLDWQSKKKFYLQLLGDKLYYFKNGHDSYPTQQYETRHISASIINSDSNESLIHIFKADSNSNSNSSLNKEKSNHNENGNGNGNENNHEDEPTEPDHPATIFKLRSQSSRSFVECVQWVHAIKRANIYYNSPNTHRLKDSETKNNDNSDDYDDDSKESVALTSLSETDLQQSQRSVVLGIAHKKGGDARSWRKRWWVLRDAHLYYFKDDFRKNKRKLGSKSKSKSKSKSPRIKTGTPQGNICLCDADVIWDREGLRTGKTHCLMIATPQRTFFVQPLQENREEFYKMVEAVCNRYWNRKQFCF